MSIANYRTTTNSSNPFTITRLHAAVSLLAFQSGYDGDPLAERIPCGKTLGDLYAAHNMFHLLPVDLRNKDRKLAQRMCQAAVFGSTSSPAEIRLPERPAGGSAQSKLDMERSRSRSGRAGR